MCLKTAGVGAYPESFVRGGGGGGGGTSNSLDSFCFSHHTLQRGEASPYQIFYPPASQTLFQWGFAGGPMKALGEVVLFQGRGPPAPPPLDPHMKILNIAVVGISVFCVLSSRYRGLVCAMAWPER